MDGASLHIEPAPPAELSGGKIGPNSVTQLADVVTEELGRDAARALFFEAGVSELLDHPPDEMIAQEVPQALFTSLWHLFPDKAAALAEAAGCRTADYIIANRIPWMAKAVLRVAPQSIAARALLKAILKNAWTFAGSGHCVIQQGETHLISIRDNPLRMPDGAWHRGVLAQLFIRLVAPGTRVRHLTDHRPDIEISRFEIILPEG